MDAFSKVFSSINKVNKNYNLKYDGYLKIKDNDGWEFVVESDCVIILPHIIDYNEFLFRKEYIPPYSYSEPEKQFFLTVVSGTIEDDETTLNTLKREIQEECGIKLNTSYNNFVHFGDFFISKGNSAKYRIYYVPLYKNDFTIVKADGDGSKAEMMSKTIRVDKNVLSSLIASDTITAYCIEKLKNI